MHFNLTSVHNLFSKWNLDLRFEEHFAKISSQNICYQKREVVRKTPDPYPWLDKDDPWRNMTDEEILYKYIDLSQSHLTNKGKEEVIDLIVTYKKAFSLRDEIGKCPDLKVNIEVNDPSTFCKQLLFANSCLLDFLFCHVQSVHWFGGIVVRGCTLRSLLGSSVHQK